MKKPVLVLFCCIPLFCAAQPNLFQLEGTISRQEKEMLTLLDETGQGKVYLNNAGEYLQVVIESEKLYVASLCVCSEDEVMVFHASAALGKINYTRGEGGTWNTGKDFIWGLRDTDMSEATIQKRKEYYEQNGWISNTMSMGEKGHAEFVINPELFKSGRIYLAAGLMPESDPETMIPLPRAGAGDCAELSLVSGSPESSYSFEPELWYSINLRSE